MKISSKGYLKFVWIKGRRYRFLSFRKGSPCKLVSQAHKEVIIIAATAIGGVGSRAPNRFHRRVEVGVREKGIKIVRKLGREGQRRGLFKGSCHGRGEKKWGEVGEMKKVGEEDLIMRGRESGGRGDPTNEGIKGQKGQ